MHNYVHVFIHIFILTLSYTLHIHNNHFIVFHPYSAPYTPTGNNIYGPTPWFQSEMNNSVVCRLKKSLYGIKQAPPACNSKITHRLHKMGFEVSKSDSSLFIRKGPEGLVCILLYMDDMVIDRPNLDAISKVKPQLLDEFKMRNLGDPHYFLGIEEIHTPDDILHWEYVPPVGQRTGLADSFPQEWRGCLLGICPSRGRNRLFGWERADSRRQGRVEVWTKSVDNISAEA